MKHKPTTARIVESDAYTKREREEIARNIIAFAEHAFVETAVNHFGVMVVKRRRMTIDELKWLAVIHDDVLGKINHKEINHATNQSQGDKNAMVISRPQ